MHEDAGSHDTAVHRQQAISAWHPFALPTHPRCWSDARIARLANWIIAIRAVQAK